MSEHYTQYTTVCYAGRKLLEQYDLSTVGIWQIFGEDSNADLHGPHYTPLLGIVEGNLDNVIRYAVDLPQFWQWGSGGEIRFIGTSIPKINVDTIRQREELKREIEEAEAALEKRKVHLKELGG